MSAENVRVRDHSRMDNETELIRMLCLYSTAHEGGNQSTTARPTRKRS